MSEVVITALGMATSLGIGAEKVCAAARAGMSQAKEIDSFVVFDEKASAMVPVLGHPVGHHTEGFAGLGRLARLGSLALGDLLATADLDPNALDRTGFFLAGPSGYHVAMGEARIFLEEDEYPAPDHQDPDTAARRASYPAALVPRVFELCRLSPPKAKAEVVLEDQAGFATSVAAAMAAIEGGAIDRAIVGGVDSLLEKGTLEALVGHDLLRMPDNPFGMVPGEAAALLLLERDKAAAQRGKKALATVEMPAVVMDPDHEHGAKPPSGRALSDAIEQAAARLHGGGGVGLLIGTHNGHPWTTMEWGRAQVRLPRPLASARQWRPAESFGDTGAALGAIGACLGAKALSKGYARTGEIMVWMSAGRGGKGAVGIHA